MDNSKKTFIKTALSYIQKYGVPGVLFATAVVGATIAFPPAIPVVVAAGAGIAYVEYKKKNPKSTFKHYVKSGVKNQRNHILRDMQATNIGQTIMQAKKRIAQKKNGLQDGETLQTVRTPLQNQTEMMLAKVAVKENVETPKKVFSDNARKANRLDHIRWVNTKKSKEK